MSEDWAFDEELAATMDAGPDLLPWLPELFQDLEDLGARSEDVVAILADADLPDGGRVLDLGSGKGAALLALAQARAIDGVGVDAMEAFVAHANQRSRSLDLHHRVRFVCRDVLDVAAEASGESADLVMMLALGPVLGDLSETISLLRRRVQPGGYILLDDAYLAEGVDPADGRFEGCLPHAETLQALTSSGDQIVAERAYEDAAYSAWCREMTDKIMARAVSLARRMPELGEAVLAFAKRQRDETELLTGPVVGALWLLRRSADGDAPASKGEIEEGEPGPGHPHGRA